MKTFANATAKRMTTKVVALLIAIILVASMMPVVTFSAEKNPSGYVYLSVSCEGQYIDDKYGKTMVYVPVALADIAAVNLTKYGLENMLYDADGDGE